MHTHALISMCFQKVFHTTSTIEVYQVTTSPRLIFWFLDILKVNKTDVAADYAIAACIDTTNVLDH